MTERTLEGAVSIQQVSKALERCSAANPTVDGRLHPEVSILSGVYGTMIFFHAEARQAGDLTDEERQVLQHWLES